MKKIAAVIVTYNRLELLKECIDSLQNQSYELTKIIIIDNDSKDGTREYLKSINNNQIIPVLLNENLGGAGGFYEGIKFASEHENEFDYVWIMDDDTIPTENSLKAIMDKTQYEDGEIGFYCSNVRWTNDEPMNIPLPKKIWSDKAINNLIEVENATFVSVLVPINNIKKYGLPIKEMFIWGDDTEYTTRLSQDYPCYFVSDSIVVHKSAVNVSKETIENVDKDRLNRYFYLYRNVLYIKRKYSTKNDFIKYLLYLIIKTIKMPFKSKKNRFLRTKVLINGIIRGVLFNPKIKYPYGK